MQPDASNEKIITEINRLYEDAHDLRVKKVLFLFRRKTERSAEERFNLLSQAYDLLMKLPEEARKTVKNADRINFDLGGCYFKGIGTKADREKAVTHFRHIQKKGFKQKFPETAKKILDFISPTFPAFALITILQFFVGFRLKYTDLIKDPLRIQICALILSMLVFILLHCLIRGIFERRGETLLKRFTTFSYGVFVGWGFSLIFQWFWPLLHDLIVGLD